MHHTFFYHILLISMILAMKSIGATSGDGTESDRFALLDVKSKILDDPFGIMNSWNDSNHFCTWVGVICNTTLKRVVALRLEARELVGSIAPSLGNLTNLREISLGDNHFHGLIPQEFGRLRQLRYLNLSSNNFSGEIPSNMSHCSELVILELSYNELIGPIPNQFFMLTKLQQLRCRDNHLTGVIPSWLGNLTAIFDLFFPYNNFQGEIPNEVGRLSKLKFFAVAVNNLTGTVPLSIFNITSLTHLTFAGNKFHGNLPQNIGFTLPNLQFFYIGVNSFRGSIPTSFVNATGLRVLDISANNLTGSVPDGFGNLRGLESFNVNNNQLGTGKVGDLNFINSLTNCTSLKILGVALNGFGGPLPSSIANLSTQLIYLLFNENRITGNIPSGIENLNSLQVLAGYKNHLNGSLPCNIGNLRNLREILFDRNKLTGPIPSSIGNLSSLNKLILSNNQIEGSIPPSLGQCKSLQLLILSHNNLSGNIPIEVLGLSSLTIYVGLDHNLLNGPLQSEVGQLVNLAWLDMSENKLSGNIPTDIGKCTSMEYLDLGGNQFEGTIPQSFQGLRGIEELNLSSNNLSGIIPEFLGNLSLLKYVDLSYNNFEGRMPEGGVFSNSTMFSIRGNNNLCGGLQELHLPLCPPNQTHLSNKRFLKSKVLIPMAVAIAFIGILVIIIFVCFMLKKSRKGVLTKSSSTKQFLPQISYLELSKSTDGFSMDNMIGSGSFGSVYKGVLSNDGSMVAIKVLNLQQQGASKSFVDECNALSNIRHRNLLKIITSCSSVDGQGNEFKALVFNFMSNGNLDSWLHPTIQGTNRRSWLSFIQRLNIAIDIARGLDYLHNHCETPIIHCDLKPSNILLDHDMVAHVGDFGLARFILKESTDQISFGQTMSLALKGSIGYIPPEYGNGSKISTEGDVFSYGILLLEMMIGKRPIDDTFENGMDIHSFTATALSHGTLGIIDPFIIFEETNGEEETIDEIQEIAIIFEQDGNEMVPRWMEECVVSIMKIGLSCSLKTPRERMQMDVVVNELQTIKSSYLKFKKEH